jgi:hypothetical protein
MAERKPPQHKVEDAQKEVERLEKEEAAPSALADPKQPMAPSHARHWIYIAVIIGGAFVFNVLLLAALGGTSG